MAKREKSEDIETVTKKSEVDNMMKDLISSINKEFGQRIAYNLLS